MAEISGLSRSAITSVSNEIVLKRSREMPIVWIARWRILAVVLLEKRCLQYRWIVCAAVASGLGAGRWCACCACGMSSELLLQWCGN